MDIARISLALDTRQLASGEAELKRLGATGDRVEKQIGGATGKMESGFAGVSGAVKTATGLIAAMGLINAAGDAVRYADAWTLVNNQLRQVTDNEGHLVATRSNLLAISRDTNSELGTTVNLYSELFRATRDLNESEESVADVTKTINNLFLAGGKAASETAGAVRQLAQGLAAGALRGDEFNSVAEGAPRILDAIAEHTGMARGELREFAAQGGITAKILIESLKGYQEEAQAAADATERTFGQKMVNAKTNVTELAGESNSLGLAVDVLGDGVLFLSEHMDTLATGTAVLAAAVGAKMTSALASSAYQMGLNIAATATATTTTNVYGQRVVVATASQNLMTAATTRLNASLALIGGPAGALLLVAGGLALLVSRMESAGERAARLRGEVENLTKSELEHAKAIALSEREMAAASVARAERTRDRSAADERAYQIQVQRLEEINGRIKKYDETLSDLSTGFKITGMSVEEYRASLGGTTSATDNLSVATGNLAGQIDGLSSSTQNAVSNAEFLDRLYSSVAVGATNTADAYVHMMEASGAAFPPIIKNVEDIDSAMDDAGSTASSLERDLVAAAEKSDRAWEDFSDSMGDMFAQWAIDGMSASDMLENYFKAAAARMVSNWISSGIMNMFGGGNGGGYGGLITSAVGGGGAGSGGVGGWTSLVTSGVGMLNGATDLIANGAGNLVRGAQTFGTTGGWVAPDMVAPKTGAGGVNMGNLGTAVMNVGAGIVGSYAGNAAGEALFNKEAESAWGATVGGIIGSIWGPLGTFVGSALGGLVDTAFGGDGMKRQNQGFLIGDTPGLKDEYAGEKYTFASGLQVQEFTRRGDEKATSELTALFGNYDATVVNLVKQLGGELKAVWMSGRDEEATLGSNGTFVGVGSAGTDIGTQLNSYVDQLAEQITGLDASLLDAVKSASSADEAIKLLADALNLREMEAQATQAKNVLLEFAGALEQGVSGADYARAQEDLGSFFSGFGLTIPKTKAEFGALVATIETSVPAGQEMISTLISMEEQIKDFYAVADYETAAHYQNVISYLETYISDFEREFGDLVGAVEEINAPVQTLTDSWRENKNALNAMIEDIASIMGELPEQTAIDKLRGTMGAINDVVGSLGSLDKAIFDLRISQGGQGAINLLKQREKELFEALESSNDPSGIADQLAATGIQRINLEAKMRQDADYRSATDIFGLTQQTRDIRIKALQDEISAAERMQDITKSLKGYLSDLKFGDLSALNPQDQLSSAKAAFDATFANAKDGDLNAMQDLSGDAEAYLREAKEFYGGATSEYAAIFQWVSGILEGMANTATTDIDLLQSQIEELEAINASQSMVEQAIVDTSAAQIEYLSEVREALTERQEELQEVADEQLTVAQEQVAEMRTMVAMQEAQIIQQANIYAGLLNELAMSRSTLESIYNTMIPQ